MLSFIQAHLHERIETLALSMPKAFSSAEKAFVLRQIEGYQKLAKKVPSWTQIPELHYPPRLSLEQCSGETTARYKALLIERLVDEKKNMADLTGGPGIDFSFLAPLFKTATYMEQWHELVALAQHNFPLLGLSHAIIMETDGTKALETLPYQSLIFIDPSRRDKAGRKTVRLQDCTPNLCELLPLLEEKSDTLLCKLSPMLDLHTALGELAPISEAHIIAAQGECKELLLVRQHKKNKEAPTRIICVDEARQFTFTREEERQTTPVYIKEGETLTDQYLYEPNPALMKAGPFRLLSTRYGVRKLHTNTQLYTSPRLLPDFPGRRFRICAQSRFNKAALKQVLANITAANLSTRNFPQSVATLRQKLRLKEGGDLYLFATTLNGNEHALLICEKH